MKIPIITDEAVKKGIHQDLSNMIEIAEARLADGNRILRDQPALDRHIQEALGHLSPDMREAYMRGMFLVIRALEEMPESGLRLVSRSDPGRSSTR